MYVSMFLAQVYVMRKPMKHYLQCQRASGKKFQELLEEVLVHPLGVEGEFYIGIPPGEHWMIISFGLKFIVNVTTVLFSG